MVKRNLLKMACACFISFFACTLSAWTERLYAFEVHYPGEDFIWYNDAAIIPGTSLYYNAAHDNVVLIDTVPGQILSGLVPGQTYKLKVTYGSGYSLTSDSCYATFTYEEGEYDEDGTLIHGDTGTLASPDGLYGFYNVRENADFDPGDYPDYDEDEYNGVYLSSQCHFYIGVTDFDYIVIEIFR